MPLPRISRRAARNPALTVSLAPGERVLAAVQVEGGRTLSATRFGLYLSAAEGSQRWGWEHISKAAFQARTLTLTVATPVGQWPDGTELLRDAPSRIFVLQSASALTDLVHARVRRSVAASSYLSWPGASGWVVLRRVPGRDGLRRQVRLDDGADPEVPGFADAVTDIARRIDPTPVPE